MKIYCGLDLSIGSTGLAVVEYLGDSKFRLIDKKYISPDRTVFGYQRKIDSIDCFKVITSTLSPYINSRFFVIEGYSFGSPGKIVDIAELTGMYKQHIISGLNKTFDVIAPKSVKKIVAGNGNASKEDVKESLKQYIVNFNEIEFERTDESDAAAVAVAFGLIKELERNSESTESSTSEKEIKKKKVRKRTSKNE